MRFWRTICLLLPIWTTVTVLNARTVVINEFMAINDSTIKDEFAQYSDWIELHNASSNSVNLAGWSLTDDATKPRKWIFPATNMPPDGYLVVFASGRDLRQPGAELHTSFQLAGDGEYLALVEPDGQTLASVFAPAYPPQQADISYGINALTIAVLDAGAACQILVPTNGALGTAWTAPDFDDAAWISGTTGVGYDVGTGYEPYIGTDVQNLMHQPGASCCLRLAFPAPSSNAATLVLNMKYDDGFVAWINGVQVAAANAPDPPLWNSTASADHPDAQALVYQPFVISGAAALLRPGVNVLAIQGFNREAYGIQADFLIVPRLSATDSETFLGYLPTPTPGAPNTGEDAPAAAVRFTPPGCTFLDSIAVTLSVDATDATVRYTLDGSEPSAASPIYSNALIVSTSRLVRARAFQLDRQPGPVRSEGYIGLQPDVRTFSSDLPVVIVDNFGAGDITEEEPKQTAFMAVFEPQADGRTCLTNKPVLTTRIGVRRRGESSLRNTNNKPNLGIETRGETDKDRNVSLLGMPSDSDWILYAPYYYDNALIRSPLAFGLSRQIGRYASRCRYAEVFLNAWGGSLSYAQHYAGVYVAMERIKRGDQRVDIQRLSPVDTNAPAISGGYMFRRDKPDTNKVAFTAGGVSELFLVDPDDTDITVSQRNWLINYINVFGYALNGQNFTDPTNGYAAYIDTPSWIDSHLLNLLFVTVDWPWLSTYMYKDRGGKIMQGPMWDVDRSMESLDVRDDEPRTWYWTPNVAGGYVFTTYWWGRLFQDPDFSQRYIDRWQELRRDAFSWENINGRIEDLAAELGEAQARNFQRWTNVSLRTNWEWEVSHVAEWLSNRVEWIDSQWPAPPQASPPGGRIAPGAAVTLTARPGSRIFYTLDGSDPRVSGGNPAAGAIEYNGPFVLPGNALLTARSGTGPPWQSLAPSNAPWSGPLRTYFVTNPAALAVTEIMYHPRAATAVEQSNGFTSADFEFIELQNIDDEPGSLMGVSLGDGINFNFATGAVTLLEPGECVVVVNNQSAFSNRYPDASHVRIAGEYEGSLNDAGERIEIVGPGESNTWAFSYGDGRGWPLAADGAGHSLVPLVFTNQDAALEWGGNWRASAYLDGSPGREDPPPIRDAVINEIMAHTDYTNKDMPEYDSDDWIELYNDTTGAVTIGGWYLSDDPANLKKWAIPATNTLAPHGWKVFDEVTGFHHPITNGFGLSKYGESLYLSRLFGATNDRVADCVSFKGQENGTSEGRYRDGAATEYALTPTPGAANQRAGRHVVISEVMYHPAPTPENPENNTHDEYIEIYNPTESPVELMSEGGAWRIDGAVAYTFPTNMTMAPREYLLAVSFDPASAAARDAFLRTYGLTNGQVRIVGPYSGGLPNRGGRLALERPVKPDLPQDPYGWFVVDEVIYGTAEPWSVGEGASLTRLAGEESGNNPTNWVATPAGTPGGVASPVVLSAPTPGGSFMTPFVVSLQAVVINDLIAGSMERVEFLDGTNLVGESYSAPYACAFTGSAARAYQFKARLVDDSGARTSPAVVEYGMAVDNATGATAIVETAANLNGRLTGGGTARVTAYWGESDEGTNAAAWMHARYLGARGTGVFTTRENDLVLGRRYYYRCYAEAGGEGQWAHETSSFRVSFDAWRYRMQITFEGYNRPAAVSNFPALVVLNTNRAGFSYSQFSSPAGTDLRFLDGGQTTALNYEIEAWNTNGESLVWVQVPHIGAATDSIWACWGNAAATVQPEYARNGATWSEGFRAVWHLNGNLEDATGNRIAAVDHGSAGASGVIGNGCAFSGGAAIDPHLNSGWYSNAMQNMTVSLWVSPLTNTNGATPFGAQKSPYSKPLLIQQSGGKWRFAVDNIAPANTEHGVDVGRWQHLALVLNAGLARAYKNGIPPGTAASYGTFAPPEDPWLGRQNGSIDSKTFFVGSIDEVRISDTIRSADWLWTEFMTASSNSTFATYSPVATSQNDDLNGDGIPDAWQRQYFGDGGPDTAPDEDWDRDGAGNREEYVADTNPTNPASFLHVEALDLLPSAVSIGFLSSSARCYTLESSTSLVNSAWSNLADQTDIPGNGSLLWLRNTNAGPVLFLRIGVRLP